MKKERKLTAESRRKLSQGGRNRWKDKTPEQKSEHMAMMAKTRWANPR